jgi:hypothetical protein
VGIVVRMRDLNRAVIWSACAVSLIMLSPARPALSDEARSCSRRHTVAIALLCCGPILRVGDAVVLDPAPYKWLGTLGFKAEVPRDSGCSA